MLSAHARRLGVKEVIEAVPRMLPSESECLAKAKGQAVLFVYSLFVWIRRHGQSSNGRAEKGHFLIYSVTVLNILGERITLPR